MSSALLSLIVGLSTASVGGLFDRVVAVVPADAQGRVVPGRAHAYGHGHLAPGGRILPPGPGAGWGFPNGAPDGYGWVDYGTYLPLGANRTPDYFFPRNFAVLPQQVFYPQYYNPYIQRGERYIPYIGAGGEHPYGGPPTASSITPMFPDRESAGTTPLSPVPSFTGEVEATPVPSLGGALNR